MGWNREGDQCQCGGLMWASGSLVGLGTRGLYRDCMKHTAVISYCEVCVLSRFSRARLCVTPWAVARRAPLSMRVSRQEYWSGLPCLSPGNLLYPGIELASLMSPALTGGFFTTSATWEASEDKEQEYYPPLTPQQGQAGERGRWAVQCIEQS